VGDGPAEAQVAMAGMDRRPEAAQPWIRILVLYGIASFVEAFGVS